MTSENPGMNGKVYMDWGKLLQITLIIVATTVLGILDVIDRSTVTLVIGAASGYVFGNGKSVREGSPPAPLIGRRPVDEQTWTLADPPQPPWSTPLGDSGAGEAP